MKRFVGSILTGVVTAGVVAAAIGPGTSPAAQGADRAPMVFGAYIEPNSGESQQQAVERVERTIGRKLGTVRSFLRWESGFPGSYHNWLVAGGREVILSIKPVRNNGSIISWRAIADAPVGSTIDKEMRSWAQRIRGLAGTVYVNLHHEPESSTRTNYGDPADYIAAWRRWVTVLRQEGATAARPMWIMTDYAFHVTSSDRRYAPSWYPGDSYVDAMAIDAYNWYDCRPSNVIAWMPLAEIIEPFRQFGAKHPDERLWLAEWGTTEDFSAPQRKAGWLSNTATMFADPKYHQFDGVAYFDHRHDTSAPAGCPWMIDSSAASQSAFSALAKHPVFTTGGTVPPPPPPPPAPSSVTRVAATSITGNTQSLSVATPTGTVAGDTMILFVSANRPDAGLSVPSGWTKLSSGVDEDVSGSAWWRRAASTSATTVTTSIQSKLDAQLITYRGVATNPIVAATVVGEPGSSTRHQAPIVAQASGGRTVHYWVDKSSTSTGWTSPPAGLTSIAQSRGSGAGYLAGLSADGPAGVATDRTATSSVSTSKTLMWSVSLRPAS